MKSVSGKVVSSKPISLFKASKILSNFAAVENGASQAVQVYLRRSAAAFEELIQVQKDVKTPHSDQKREKHHNRRIEIDKRNEDLEKVEPSQQLESDLRIGKHKKHLSADVINEDKLEELDERITKDGQKNVQLGEVEKKWKKNEGMEREDEWKDEGKSKVFDQKTHNVEDSVRKMKKQLKRNKFVEREVENMDQRKIRESDNAEDRENVRKDDGEYSAKKREKKSKKNKGLDREVESNLGFDKDRAENGDDANVGKGDGKNVEDSVRKTEKKASIEREDVNEGKEKKNKKKRKNREADGEELVHDYVEQSGLKKKKKRKTELE